MTEGAEPDLPLPRRHPLVALLLSLVAPGLGHLYAGAARWAAFVVAVVVIYWASALFLLLNPLVPPLGALLWMSVLPLLLLIGVHAAWTARRQREAFIPRPYNRWFVYVLVIGAWIGVAQIPGRFINAYHVPSGAMEPNLLIGDYVMTERFRSPAQVDALRHGVIVLHESLDEPGLNIIKRVVGLPGDTLEMRTDSLFRNSVLVSEPYAVHRDGTGEMDESARQHSRRWQAPHVLRDTSAYLPSLRVWGPLVVPPGHYFILGDNRDASYDSRYWGFLPRNRLRGRPRSIYFSVDHDRGTPLPYVTAIRWVRLGRRVP